MTSQLAPHPSWPKPQPGWTFVHHPMNRCSGKTNRCTIDKVENGTVFWHADTEDAAARGAYATPLYWFAHQMARGELFTPPEVLRLTPKGCTCP